MRTCYRNSLIACLAGLLFLPLAASAQYWTTRLLESNTGIETAAASDHHAGITVVTGTMRLQNGLHQMYTVCIDAGGDTLWTQKESHQFDCHGTHVRIQSDGGIVAAGVFWSGSAWTPLVQKYEQSGNRAWRKDFIPLEGYCLYPRDLELLDDGSPIMLCEQFNRNERSALLYALSTTGTSWWSRNESAILVDMHIFSDEITAVGSIAGSGNSRDMHALRLSRSGAFLNFITLDAAQNMDDALSAVTADANGVYAAGRIPDASGDVILSMLRWDGASTSSFHTFLAQSGAHRFRDLRLVPGQGVAAAARVENASGGMEMLVGLFDAGGTLQWTDRKDGGASNDNRAPLFGGGAAATVLSEDSVFVTWAPARDDVSTSDELVYSVYSAMTSGGQNFSTATLTVTGAQSAVLTGLTPATDYYIVVRAEDREGNRDANTREIHVKTGGSSLRISTESLTPAEVCQPYSFTLQAEGGRPPYEWSILTGAFPAEFALAENGTLTGDATVSGSYTFTVGVEDADGLTTTKELTLIINAAPRLHVTTDMSLAGGSHCYSSIIVAPGVTLTLQGAAILRCSDSLIVEGAIIAACAELQIVDYQYALIRGRIDNRCATGDTTSGPSILIFSHRGDFYLEMGGAGSGIFSHGGFHLTDDTTIAEWETVVTPDARSTVPLDPVANITADVLNDAISEGEEVEVSFTCAGADPDGGEVTLAIDFGDGDLRSGLYPENGAELIIDKFYDTPGTYLVTLTVEDDEQRTTGAMVQLHIGDSLSEGADGLGASIYAGDLLMRSTDSVYFSLDDGSGPTTTLTSILWDFGDGQTSPAPRPAYMYAAPGRYPVTCSVTDDSGNTAMVQQSVYIYTPDTNAVRFTPPGKGGSISGTALQNRIAVVDAPILVNRRIVYRGFDHLIVDEHAHVRSRNGNDGRPGVASGSRGRGLSAYSPGWLVVNGATLQAGNGGNGAVNRPTGTRSTKGGKGGSLNISGRNVNIGGGATLSAGNGGNGGDASVSVPASGVARANAQKGGDAGSRVRIRATNAVTFSGPVTIHTGNGGRGGNATATGGPGKNQCTTGQEGGKGRAHAGRGGKAGKRGTITGTVFGMNNVTVTGGQGGNGGTATANGGKGGDATCEDLAIGGQGGWAKAFGGDGGKSGYQGAAVAGSENFKPGKGGDAIANPGDGGMGTGIPNPAKGQDGCPGENGGDAVAFGGNGGDALAVTGEKGRLVGSGQDAEAGTATANGADGGNANATGGDGGNGTHCDCDGGNGGKAEAYGGFRGDTEARAKSNGTETEVEGKDGSSSALGGRGGEGGHCCTPPGPVGGDGGNGGDADAWAGPNGGVGDALGGDGGDGGDGKGPGLGGLGGIATSHATAGIEIDGADGADGEWCFLVDSWYIYYSTIADGIINPGTDVSLGTYTDKDLATQIGTVNVHFMTQQEIGMPQPVSYFKSGPQVILETGGMSIDMTSLSDIVDPSRTWLDNEYSMRFEMLGTMPGMLTILGYENNQVIAMREVFLDPAVGSYQEGIAAPQGSHLEQVTVITDSPVSFDHWEVEIIVVDP